MWRSEGNVQELPFSFLCVCYRYQTWVIKLGRKWLHSLSYLRPSSGNFFIDTSLCLIWSPCSPSHVRHNTQAISSHHFNFTWGFCLGEFCVCLFGFLSIFLSSPKMGFHLITRGVLSTHVLITQPRFPKSDKLLTRSTRVCPTEDFLQAFLGQSQHGEAVMYPVYTHIPACPLVCGMRSIFPESQFQPWKNLSKSFPQTSSSCTNDMRQIQEH